MHPTSPFSPSFGTRPPVLVGRAPVVDRLTAALAAGPSDPDFTLLVTGIRGSGKTVFLAEARRAAAAMGWGVIEVETPGDGGLSDRVLDAALSPDAVGRRRFRRGPRLSGLQAFGVGVDWETQPTGPSRALKPVLTELGSQMARRGRGILITADELHAAQAVEIRSFALTLQSVTRVNGHPVAFLGAGLPELIDKIDKDRGMTFFQRCARAGIGLLSDDEVRTAIDEPIRRWDGSIDDDALQSAVGAAGGYPFKVQLIGHHAWRRAAPEKRIRRVDVEEAANIADRVMGEQLFTPLWAGMSPVDRAVVEAMALDEESSSLRDLARRIGADSSYLSTYVGRLAAAGVADRPAPGRVGFVHDAMRDWVRARRVDQGGGPDAEATGSGHARRSPLLSDVIRSEYIKDPSVSNAAIGRSVGASRSYVGKVLSEMRRQSA